MTDAHERLVGLWRTDPNDRDSLREYGDVSLQFDSSGNLVYTVHLPNKEQFMYLTYRLDGKWLVTNQPSHPREERVEFYFASDGRLALRNPPPAPTSFYVRAKLPLKV